MDNRKETSPLTSEDLKIMKKIEERQSKTSFQRQTKTCSVKNCNKKHFAKGFCHNHYKKNHINPKTCSVEDCNRPHSAKGYCKSHYEKFVGYPKKRTKLLEDPEKHEQHKKHVMELYYNRHGIQKRQKRELAKRKSRQVIKMLGGKCESCGEKFNPDLKRSNLDFHHRHYDEKDKELRRKWGNVPNVVHEIEVLIKEGKNPKKKFALLCTQCNSIEAFVRIDKKKAFETFMWLYEENYFDEALSDDKSLRKITEFIDS